MWACSRGRVHRCSDVNSAWLGVGCAVGECADVIVKQTPVHSSWLHTIMPRDTPVCSDVAFTRPLVKGRWRFSAKDPL